MFDQPTLPENIIQVCVIHQELHFPCETEITFAVGEGQRGVCKLGYRPEKIM
jgi:hypothetical protein